MTMIIEVTSRDWDVENVTNALVLPAQREYVGHLTVDDDNAQTVFDRDVQLVSLYQRDNLLQVQEWDEATGNSAGDVLTFRVADIRRVEFY